MRPRIKLLIFAILSLGLIHFTDKFAFQLFEIVAPSLSILARIRIPSLLLCFALYWYTGREQSFRLPQNRAAWIESAKVAAPWLLAGVYFVLIKKMWVPTIWGFIDTTAFMVTGLLAEEFLFRGAAYQLAQGAFPTQMVRKIPVAVIISALLFALHHLSFHGFRLTPAAGMQVFYTFIMGIFFGLIRDRSKSIWPGTITHVINNCLTMFRNFY